MRKASGALEEDRKYVNINEDLNDLNAILKTLVPISSQAHFIRIEGSTEKREPLKS